MGRNVAGRNVAEGPMMSSLAQKWISEAEDPPARSLGTLFMSAPHLAYSCMGRMPSHAQTSDLRHAFRVLSMQ